jgi:hypothetical protein
MRKKQLLPHSRLPLALALGLSLVTLVVLFSLFAEARV